MGCYFLVPNKKVTKEVGIGEALNVALPRAKIRPPLCTPPGPVEALIVVVGKKGNIT